jgi:hypothetical protein
MCQGFADLPTLLAEVDAVCIDQSNIPERNAQVLRMKEIYEKARKVVVWLGPAGEDSNIAIDIIQELSTLDARPEKVQHVAYQ